MEMADHTKICDILTYSRNEVKVVCKFQTLLELFQEQCTLKAKELEEKALREASFKDLKMPETRSSINFEA